MSFGQCATACGSLGAIANPEDLIFDLDVEHAQVLFTTCAVNDEALLRIPITSNSLVSMKTSLRASGLGTVWPSGADSEEFGKHFIAEASLNGEIIVSFPIYDNNLQLSEFKVSIHFISKWENVVWPDRNNVLFYRIPLETLLQEWTRQFNASFSTSMETNMKRVLLFADKPLRCNYPAFTKMVCTKEMAESQTTLLPSSCHPCDTCCRCFVQQRCDSGCDQCACVKCGANPWKFGTFIIAMLVLIACFFVTRKCIHLTFFNNL